MKAYIEKIIHGQDLTSDEMTQALTALMHGEVNPVIASSFLTALKMKGESIEEIVAGAKVMRKEASAIYVDHPITLDTCGTGGDASNTFNISTAVAIVAAASGIAVVKHGNRSVSSQCGCADVLEALGVKIDLSPTQVKHCVDTIGIGFLFAPTFHSAMRHVAPVRKILGMRTIFNILGPLSNPAHATHQLVGVFDPSLLDIYGNVLKELGIKRAMIVHGEDGLDEISLSAPTKICELRDGKLHRYTIKPEDFNLKSASLDTIRGGDKNYSATILRQLFTGSKGPKRDIVLLNAGAAFYLSGKADSIQLGIELAKEIIDSDKALAKLDTFIQQTNQY